MALNFSACPRVPTLCSHNLCCFSHTKHCSYIPPPDHHTLLGCSKRLTQCMSFAALTSTIAMLLFSSQLMKLSSGVQQAVWLLPVQLVFKGFLSSVISCFPRGWVPVALRSTPTPFGGSGFSSGCPSPMFGTRVFHSPGRAACQGYESRQPEAD